MRFYVCRLFIVFEVKTENFKNIYFIISFLKTRNIEF